MSTTIEKKDFFSVLSAIDCSKLVQKRNSLDYLPWATTWKLLKQHYPYSTYRVRKAADGRNYHHDDRTAWVEVELTLVEENNDGTFRENSITEMLAIMDYAKRSIPLEKLNSTDVVNTIQRCLTKACARMGLGIAIYGAMDYDDLPEEKQPLPENVVDLTEIRERLDVGIKNYTKGMSKEQKVHFVNNITEEQPFRPEDYVEAVQWAEQGIQAMQQRDLPDWFECRPEQFYCTCLCAARDACPYGNYQYHRKERHERKERSFEPFPA